MPRILAWTLAGLISCAAPTAAENTPQLAIRIVPTDAKAATIRLDAPGQHFHVVLTNVSKQPVRLWREWCSWGYYALSFRVTAGNGKQTTVKKLPRVWTKNLPDWMQLGPGDHMIFEVTFDPTVWDSPPLPPSGASQTATLTAIYELTASPESKQQAVWVGRVATSDLRVAIVR